MRIKLLLFFLAITVCLSAYSQDAPKSDHIIFDQFGAWKTRHVFDQKTLVHKYSDAKAQIVVNNGKDSTTFQINQRGGGDETVFIIIPGWWDEVQFTIDGKVFNYTQRSMHTFYEIATPDFLAALANAKGDIKVMLRISESTYHGVISAKGSSAALRWVRVIE